MTKEAIPASRGWPTPARTTMKQPISLLAIACLAAAPAIAAVHVDVKDAVVRMPKAGFAATVVSMTLRTNADATLVSASSPVAGAIELRTMKREGVDVRMETVPGIPLSADGELRLRTGVGEHFLLAQKIRKPLYPGEQVPLTLKLKQADGRVVSFAVRATVVAPKSYNPVPEEDRH